MDSYLWNKLIWNLGFLLVTYAPMQVLALWRQRGVNRIATAVPLLFMVPMIAGACSLDAYRDGSLFGMYYFVPYLPAMLYLMVAVLNVPKCCQQCGQQLTRRSFRPTPKLCGQCAVASIHPESPSPLTTDK